MKKKSFFASFKFKIFLLIVLTIITSGAITYGFYNANKNQSGLSKVTTECFDVTFTEGESISLNNAVSMTDMSGMKLEPYTFSITNTCDNETAYTILLNTKVGSFKDDFVSASLNKEKARALSNVSKNKVYEVEEGYGNSYILKRGTLKLGETVEYDLRLWINAKATYEDVKGLSWDGQIKIVTGIKDVEDMKILSSKLKTLAKDENPKFNSTATTDEGVYSMQDDDGTSYYYRGASKNNYLKFAGMFFRVVRLNGDGSLRIVYDGTIAHQNGDTSIDRIAKENVASLIEGNENNINSQLEDWYQTNIVSKGFDKYIAKTKFCNGIKNEMTIPTFKCNGYLETKSVGLLTVDEVFAAGINGKDINTSNYLYRGASYWLNNPKDEDSNINILSSTGKIEAVNLTSSNGLVPVINISSNYVDSITGSGSIENPYILD